MSGDCQSKPTSRLLFQLGSIPANARVVIYGTGKRGTSLAGRLRSQRPDISILGFVDSSACSAAHEGLPLYGPAALADLNPDLCIIASAFYPEIIRTLLDLKISRYLVYFDCEKEEKNTEMPTLVPGEASVLGAGIQRTLIESAFKTGLLRSTVRLEGPLLVNVTNICNAKCVFCARHKATGKLMVMDHELFCHIVREFVGAGGEHLDLTPMLGDCLIDPEITRKILAAKEMGIRRISFSTNGIGLARLGKELEVLVKCVDLISISSPGLSPAAYRELYRVDACSTVVAGLKALAEARSRLDGPLKTGVVFRTARSGTELARDEGVIELQSQVEQGLLNIDFQNRRREFENLGSMVSQQDLPEGMTIKPYWLPEEPSRPPCMSLLTGFLVLPDGSAKLCGCAYSNSPFSDFIIGDCRTTPLREILNGRLHTEILRGFFEKTPQVCADCSRYMLPSESPSLRKMMTAMLFDAPYGRSDLGTASAGAVE